MIRKICILLRMIWFKICNPTSNVPKILGKIYWDNKNVEFGKNVSLCRNVRFWGDGKIVIGDNVVIGDNCTIYASKEAGVVIGNNTFIAADGYIIDMNHGFEYGKSIKECENSYEKIEIGENVWIGQNVTILMGSTLGKGCVVGAKSLVNKKFGDELVIAGIPAKILSEKKVKHE